MTNVVRVFQVPNSSYATIKTKLHDPWYGCYIGSSVFSVTSLPDLKSWTKALVHLITLPSFAPTQVMASGNDGPEVRHFAANRREYNSNTNIYPAHSPSSSTRVRRFPPASQGFRFGVSNGFVLHGKFPTRPDLSDDKACRCNLRTRLLRTTCMRRVCYRPVLQLRLLPFSYGTKLSSAECPGKRTSCMPLRAPRVVLIKGLRRAESLPTLK